MNISIFLNGKFDKTKIENDISIAIAVDGGYKYCLENNIEPELIIGDFDSFEYKEIISKNKIIKFDPIKNNIDGELALKILIEKYNKPYCTIYGGLGNRFDMTLLNLKIFEQAWINNKINGFKFIFNEQKIFSVNKEQRIQGNINDRISFWSLNKVKELSLKGFKYNVNKIELNKNETLCLSNELYLEEGNVNYKTGNLICWHEKIK